jgi:Mce-associated membrane protein
MSQPAHTVEDTPVDDTTADAAADASESDHARTRSALAERVHRAGNSSVPLKTMAAWTVVIAVAIAIAALGWQWHSKADEVDTMHAAAAGAAHAEQIGLDYATAAAQMDFHNLDSWRANLTKGTSPELTNRLTQAATSMQQIITPLQWVSSAQPITAKTVSDNNGVYQVDCFVSVLTKNSQAPDGIQSTASYTLTINSHDNWTITDVGGVGSTLDGTGTPR